MVAQTQKPKIMTFLITIPVALSKDRSFTLTRKMILGLACIAIDAITLATALRAIY